MSVQKSQVHKMAKITRWRKEIMLGWSGYVRAMVELHADTKLKDTLVVFVPIFLGDGCTRSTIRVENEWTPLECLSCMVFCHVLDECPKKIVSNVLKNLKNPQLSNNIPFDALNTVENDDDLGTNRGNSKLAEKGANFDVVSFAHGTLYEAFGSPTTISLAERINDLEIQMMNEKRMLVDDDNLMASTSSTVDKSSKVVVVYEIRACMKDGETYNEDMYDDDYFYHCGLTDSQMKFVNAFDINLRVARDFSSLIMKNTYWHTTRTTIVNEARVLKNQGIDFFEFLKLKVGDGCTIRFWKDRWCEAGILKDLFPRIYALETCKDVNIRAKLEASSLETSLRRNVRGGAKQAQLIAVSEVSSNITLAPQADRYNWLLNNDGVYSVASLRKKIDNQRSPSEA
nr:RNA-directed DNA polymerase, eukaryota, reverse transcriptase zinc-binding domain protein [Tanacetum cinerariifolium]